MKKNRKEIIAYINSLKGYQGYIQFSNRPIEDIYEEFSDIKVEEREGFVSEAYFYNGQESLTIKQQNSHWFISQTDIDSDSLESKDVQIYLGINKLKVKMLQVWVEVEDEFCEGMQVKKLQKNVFVGFKIGASK